MQRLVRHCRFRSCLSPRPLRANFSTKVEQRAVDSNGQISIQARPSQVQKRLAIRRVVNAPGEAALASKGIATSDTVVSTCTASSFDMPRLAQFLKGTFPYVKVIEGDVIHLRIPAEGDSRQVPEIFFFINGCFVIWASPTDAASLLLKFKGATRPFEVGPLKVAESETLFFQRTIGERSYAGMRGEMIILEETGDDEPSAIGARLAFSNGLADSVKLAVLENDLEEHIEKVKPIPSALAGGGKLAVDRADVLKLTGELLKFRAELNLNSELIETPEMYWSEPQLEELYRRISRVLDIGQRVHVLNKKLDYANELATVLRSHLSERHGLKLEWGIIALIAVEVAFEVLHWVAE